MKGIARAVYRGTHYPGYFHGLTSTRGSGPGRPSGHREVRCCSPRPKRASAGLLGALAGALMLAGCSETNPSPVRVIDGDTIVLTDTNTHVRLSGVDAPEVAHPGYARDDDFGPEAREEMRRIVGDKPVRCELNGERSHNRVVGTCFCPTGQTSAPNSSDEGWPWIARISVTGGIARWSPTASARSSVRRRTVRCRLRRSGCRNESPPLRQPPAPPRGRAVRRAGRRYPGERAARTDQDL